MLNIIATSLFTTWVKNVYSLCVEGVVTRVKSYTGVGISFVQPTTLRVKPQVITTNLDSFTPTLYTRNSGVFNLLNSHFYTLSTVPTIKKMKKK